MSKTSHLLVIVFISTAQLALTLTAVAWVFSWIDSQSQSHAQRQASQMSQFVSAQIGERVKDLKLSDVRRDSEDWHRLQQFVASTALPDHGFISVIAATDGKIICHPAAWESPEIIGMTWDQALVDPDHNTLVSALGSASFDNRSNIAITVGNSNYCVDGYLIGDLDIWVLTHLKMSGNYQFSQTMIASVKSFSFAVALIIGLLGTVLNFFMVKRIVDADERVQANLEETIEQRTTELRRTKNATIFGLAKLAESRDNDTGEHLDRIRKYVTILAKDLARIYPEIDDEYICNLGIASSLHDIGKVGIPDSILLKPGKLTSLERSIMEKHTVIGGECLDAISSKLGDNDFLEMAREVAYWHHEQWDGNGYPHRLEGSSIPISARIVAVADVYDALTSRRPYKRSMSHTESRAIILSGSGQRFDPEIIAAFLRHECEFEQIAKRYHHIDETKPVPGLESDMLTATGPLSPLVDPA